MKLTLSILICYISSIAYSQNSLFIPASITSNIISLTLDEGTTNFYPGITTNTMGANGALLGPTLIMSEGDNVDITVDNQLSDTTTIHWHGMHVAPENDGGPHSIINPNTTWNPQFTVMDKAGLNWYHPHLHMRTGEHVSKGIAGLIIVRDTEEASLNLPMNYGVDEFPIIFQTKGFDASGQIIFHTDLDTSVMVNGTVDATIDFPAQVVRLRVLNGSSQRVMEFGFSDNRTFSLIGTDGGLLAAPVNATRYRISPGQRADILVDLTTSFGQNIQLMSFASELPNAIYGATQPGMGAGATASLPDYTSNPLNGADYQLLDINIVAQTASPVLTIPSALAVFTPLLETDANITRSLTFTSSGAMGNLNGPFLINGSTFDMATINYTVPLDNIEIWSLTNQTPIAHPFHIHDVQFFILDINGNPPPAELQGYNDVVLVPGGNGVVRFIAQFSDHANDSIPYMYHCHMLPHEDMGMMGQFLVVDPTSDIDEITKPEWNIYPNPSNGSLSINTENPLELTVTSASGKIIRKLMVKSSTNVDLDLKTGLYFISDSNGNTNKLIVQ
ncbi:MAG: blue copper oxidase [Parvicella sp.]|jgi:blue copper oxidase